MSAFQSSKTNFKIARQSFQDRRSFHCTRSVPHTIPQSRSRSTAPFTQRGLFALCRFVFPFNYMHEHRECISIVEDEFQDCKAIISRPQVISSHTQCAHQSISKSAISKSSSVTASSKDSEFATFSLTALSSLSISSLSLSISFLTLSLP